MTHENVFHDNVVAMLELIWGEGYMAPGGPGNVAKMLDGLDTQGKRILDIGCGIGGPALEMAKTHGAKVVGIDLEAPLIDHAKKAAKSLGLQEQCTFQTVEVGPLPFGDQSFDIVVSSAAFLHIEDKAGILGESLRVLRPGGHLSCYDWLKSDSDYSDDMHYYIKMERLTIALETLRGYKAKFINAGFVDVTATDAADWYRAEARREYELVKGELYPRMVELLGQTYADHIVENWRAIVVVTDNGEMRQGYCRGRRPV